MQNDLFSPNRETRLQALRSFEGVVDLSQENLLLDLLVVERDAEVVTELCAILTMLGSPRFIEPLREALTHWISTPVADVIADAIVKITCKKEEALLFSADARAADLLERHGVDIKNPEALGNALRSYEMDVRLAAVSALRSFGENSHLDLIATALEDPDWEVRWQAAHALCDAHDPRALEPIARELHHPDYLIRLEAAQMLYLLGDTRGLSVMKEAIGHHDRAVQQFAIEIVRVFGIDDALSLLAPALQSRSVAVRALAVTELGMLYDTRAVDLLIATLNDRSARIREEAVKALESQRDQRAVAPLIAKLHDRAIDVRVAAAHALGALGDPRAIPSLLEHYASDEVLVAVVYALAKLKVPDVLPALLALLDDENPYIRVDAVKALCDVGDMQALQPLISLLNDSSDMVRKASVDALGDLAKTLGPQTEFRDVSLALAPLLNEHHEFLLLSTVRALGKIGDATSCTLLHEALTSSNAHVRLQAALELGRLGDQRAIDVLKQLVNTTDGFVSESALQGLWSLHAISLEQLLAYTHETEETDTRQTAIRILSGLDEDSARQRLYALLTAGETWVRKDVAVALANDHDEQTIAALLCALMSEQERKVQHAIMASLATLTQQDFGHDREAWLNWGADRGNSR